MKKILALLLFLSPFLIFAGNWDGAEEVKKEVWKMSALFFIIASLFIGIICKHFLKKVPIPFTVILLIIGLILGLIHRFEWLENISLLDESIFWAGHINQKLFFMFSFLL